MRIQATLNDKLKSLVRITHLSQIGYIIVQNGMIVTFLSEKF